MSTDAPSLDGRVMVGVANAGGGQVGTETRFRYREQGGVVSAEYAGGAIVHGHLVGTRTGDRLEFRYAHLDADGRTSTGRCTSEVSVLADGRLRLDEAWAWESRPGSGTSVVEEVADATTLPRSTTLAVRLGAAGGHRVDLLAIEVWPDRWDLRFARTTVTPGAPLPRRIPPADAWSVADDIGTTYDVVDVNGRGDRERSTGEVQLRPSIPTGARRLAVRVVLTPGEAALSGAVDLRAPSG